MRPPPPPSPPMVGSCNSTRNAKRETCPRLLHVTRNFSWTHRARSAAWRNSLALLGGLNSERREFQSADGCAQSLQVLVTHRSFHHLQVLGRHLAMSQFVHDSMSSALSVDLPSKTHCHLCSRSKHPFVPLTPLELAVEKHLVWRLNF